MKPSLSSVTSTMSPTAYAGVPKMPPPLLGVRAGPLNSPPPLLGARSALPKRPPPLPGVRPPLPKRPPPLLAADAGDSFSPKGGLPAEVPLLAAEAGGGLAPKEGLPPKVSVLAWPPAVPLLGGPSRLEALAACVPLPAGPWPVECTSGPGLGLVVASSPRLPPSPCFNLAPAPRRPAPKPSKRSWSWRRPSVWFLPPPRFDRLGGDGRVALGLALSRPGGSVRGDLAAQSSATVRSSLETRATTCR